MDSDNQQCYQVAPLEAAAASSTHTSLTSEMPHAIALEKSANMPSVLEGVDAADILKYLHSGQLLSISKGRRNGLILFKDYHAEFAGPGAAVGGIFDLECHQVIPVGNLCLSRTKTHEERKDAYLIRRQWIKLTQQFTDQSLPLQRAQMILTQFETYFDQAAIARIPDEAFALLVGVLPYSVRMARRTPGKLHVKVKVKGEG